MQRASQNLNALQRWALALKARTNQNKATCALANKLARIAWSTWRHGTVFVCRNHVRSGWAAAASRARQSLRSGSSAFPHAGGSTSSGAPVVVV